MKCKYEGNGVWEGRCVGTKEVEPCKGYEKCKSYCPDYQTNADRIRSMSDEELAEWMSRHNAYGENAEAVQWLSWLRMPAEGEHHG